MRAYLILRTVLAALALGLVVYLAPPAAAQQTNNFNPTANAVKEEQLLNALKPGAQLQGRVSIPDQKAASLIRPAGRDWREFHEGTMRLVGALAVLGMLAVLVLFYVTRGRIMIDSGRAGQTITRFGGFERFIHWLAAVSFILLALTGLVTAFGKTVLLPVIGAEAFSLIASMGKYIHNYMAFPFMFGVALIFLAWVKDNIPAVEDMKWLMIAGGLFGHRHPPARRFNAGQKLIFWSVVVGGALLSISGIHLLFPSIADGIAEVQFHNMLHGIVSMLLIAAMLAHAYIGSVGMEGASDAMTSGEVDLNWAREHHSLWVQEELKRGVSPAPAMQPAE